MKSKPTLTCTYLFDDGHAVQIFEKEDADAGRITYAVVIERFTEAECNFSGRIIFGRYREGMTALIRTARQIRATEPNSNWGSDATKKAGIAVGSLTVTTAQGDLYWYDMPGLISGCYTFQGGPAYAEKFDPNILHWAMHRVSKIIRVKSANQLQPA